MSIVLPKFDFSKSSVKSTAELEKEQAETGTLQNKNFLPGTYKCRIVSASFQGPASDPNWGKVLLTLEGLGGRTITHQLLIPLGDIKYKTASGKNPLFAYVKFQKFMEALGVNVTVETLGQTMAKYFADPNKALKNEEVEVDIGYDGNHVKYDGKDEAGNKRYVLAYRSGDPMNEDVYPDFKSAQAAAEAQGLSIERFVEILAFRQGGATKTTGKTSNW